MSLEAYRRKRNFERTPEPSGDALDEAGAPQEAPERPVPEPDRPRFVVGRHRATRLHYDLRLEIAGVLASWSVPKGPTLDPAVRRMAVRVEDHPMEYMDFEGVIPKGEYGAGDAIVWDRGTYEPELPGDPADFIAAGELKLRFHGEKLRGRFTLVHTSGDQWLLLKKRDPEAVAGWDPEAHPRSVASGRTNEEVREALGAPPRESGGTRTAGGRAANRATTTAAPEPATGTAADARARTSAAPASAAPASASSAAARPAPTDLATVPGASVAPMPGFLEPMAAALGGGPFDDPEWLFEIKWDGYRLEARVRAGAVRLWTRRGRDGAQYAPELLGRPDWIAADEAVVDGELVALRPDGLPDFGLLQARVGHAERWSRGRTPDEIAGGDPATAADAPLVYQVFDLLYLDGHSLLNVPLATRKALLRERMVEHPLVRYAGHVTGDGRAFFDAAATKGLEGIVAKRAASRYLPGARSGDWLKLKARPEQEFVVAGYSTGAGSHADLGALILAVNDGGALRYAGRVGSGMDARMRRRLRGALDDLVVPAPQAESMPRGELDDRSVHWVRPTLVVRVAFAGWTREGRVRQSSFAGVLPDRDPSDVVREVPVDAAADDAGPEDAQADDSGGGVAVGDESNIARGARTPGGHQSGDPAAAEGARRAPARKRASAVAPGHAAVPGPGERPGAPSAPGVKAAPSAARGAQSADGAAHAPARAARVSRTDRPAPDDASAAVVHDALAALEALGAEGVIDIDRRPVKLTNLDKVLFPPRGATSAGDGKRGRSGPTSGAGARPGDGARAGEPVTKRDLVRYYVTVAPTLLPHLAGRPLNLTRYPNGVDRPSFWQRELPQGSPSWLTTWREPAPQSNRAPHTYVVADSVATMAWLANQAAVEIHPWTSRIDEPWRPIYALIDIDPGPETRFPDVVFLANLYRTALEHLGVRGYPKMTGKRGIQVFVPIEPRYTYDETRGWVEGLSRAVGAAAPDLVSWEWSVDRRGGRARLDYTQNVPTKTLVAPYSVRAAAGAPVSAPITWDELDDPDIRPDSWTLRTLPPRLAERGDLFAAALTDLQVLPPL